MDDLYELFSTALPPEAFTPADVVNLYLHRGAFECVLGDEDAEQDPDHWCSHTTWGKAVLAHSGTMDLEPPPRIGTCAASRGHAHDGICSRPGDGRRIQHLMEIARSAAKRPI